MNLCIAVSFQDLTSGDVVHSPDWDTSVHHYPCVQDLFACVQGMLQSQDKSVCAFGYLFPSQPDGHLLEVLIALRQGMNSDRSASVCASGSLPCYPAGKHLLMVLAARLLTPTQLS